MSFGNLLYLQADNVRRRVRYIENQENKLANTRIAAVFNQICYNENIHIYKYIKQVLLKTMATRALVSFFSRFSSLRTCFLILSG